MGSRTRGRGTPGFAAALIASIASVGCGGHLHRAGDAGLSERALSSVDALDFGAGFTAREEAEGELLERELAAGREQIDADRDAALLAVLEDVGGTGRRTWEGKLDAQLAELTGVGMDPDFAGLGARLTQSGQELGRFEAAFRGLERARDSYLARAVALGLDLHEAPHPSCPGADDPGRDPGLDEEYAAFSEACAGLESVLGELAGADSSVGGELGALAGRLLAVHTSAGARAERAQKPISAYVDAREACRALDDEDFVAVGRCLEQRLAKTLLGLDGFALEEAERAAFVAVDLDSLGDGPGDPLRLRLLDEQLDAVERVLEYEASGRFTADGDPLDKPKELARTDELDAVALALAVSGTVARVRLGPKPRSYGVRGSELGLVRELLAVERDGTATIHRLAQRRLDLLHLGLEAMLRERLALLAAQSFLLDPSCAPLGIGDALLAGQEPAGGSAGERLCASYLRGSLIEYANAWTLGAARVRESEIRGDALHERELRVRSSMALAIRGIWMAAAVAELHRYNASGLRPETLATVLTNLAGFAVVAAGVFR